MNAQPTGAPSKVATRTPRADNSARNGTGSSSSFNAQAQGDLNGDSKYSLFQRTGTVTSSNNVSGGAGGIPHGQLLARHCGAVTKSQ